MVDQFLTQGLKKGDSIEIELNNGSVITGILSDDRVRIEQGEATSRIGVLLPALRRERIYGNVPPKGGTHKFTDHIKISMNVKPLENSDVLKLL